MRIGLVILIAFVSCRPDKKVAVSRLASLDTLANFKIFSGDSIKLYLDDKELTNGLDPFPDNSNYSPVDSLFYYTYLHDKKPFFGFRVSVPENGGPDCRQYYYGIVRREDNEFKRILVLQQYFFHDNLNSLFLMTFNKNDSLTSILQVASTVYKMDTIAISNSIMYIDNRIVKYELTGGTKPDDVDKVKRRLLYCKDSVTKNYYFSTGNYTLTKRDSIRTCKWKEN